MRQAKQANQAKKPTATARRKGREPLPPPDKRAVRQPKLPNVTSELVDNLAYAALFRQYLQLREESKALLGQQDVLLGQILREVGANRPVVLSEGRVAILVDLFLEKNIVWRAHANRRYEVKTMGEQAP